ncbi:MAG: hypothetical protein KAJ40_07990, partial [Alphaproteobacteria bacterium]|nr:hypothetical protein [Alphaproteobacteria bacterium]
RVVRRAGEILKNIEKGEFTQDGTPTIVKDSPLKKVRKQTHPSQLPLFPLPENDPLRLYLQGLEADELSPRQALDVVYDLLKFLN